MELDPKPSEDGLICLTDLTFVRLIISTEAISVKFFDWLFVMGLHQIIIELKREKILTQLT